MITEKNFNEEELFRRMVAGDEAAYGEIFRYYYPRVLSFTVKITRSLEDAEEIAQEVFLRLWKRRLEFRQDSIVGAWLYKVAANLAFNFLKKLALQQKLVRYYSATEDFFKDLLPELEQKEKQAEFTSIIQKLPPQQSRIFQMSRERGLSHQQIAEELGISQNTVKNHLVKALQALRKALQKGMGLLFSLLGLWIHLLP